MSKKLKAAIIGCGNIGSLYDENVESSAYPRSYARAYFENSDVDLIVVCDNDILRAKKCAEHWKVPHYCENPREIIQSEPDIISICTPESSRISIFDALSGVTCKAILCEKPWASTLQSAQILLEKSKTITSHLTINFSRRWDKGLLTIVTQIKSGYFGRFTGGTCLYGKGISNNGSHIIDVLNWALGVPKSVYTRSLTKDNREDFDPTLTVQLEYPDGHTIDIIGTDYRNYSLWEIDLLFTSGRIRITDNGFTLHTYLVQNHSIYSGYKQLVEEAQIESTLEASLSIAIAEIIANETPSCTVHDAMAVLHVVDAATRSLNSKQFEMV
jgi:predicted dehydrogenase